MKNYPTEIFIDQALAKPLACAACKCIHFTSQATTRPPETVKQFPALSDCKFGNHGCGSHLNVASGRIDLTVMEDLVRNARVKCVSWTFCEWKGELWRLDGHLVDECGAFEIKCNQIGCDFVTKRNLMRYHTPECLFKVIIDSRPNGPSDACNLPPSDSLENPREPKNEDAITLSQTSNDHSENAPDSFLIEELNEDIDGFFLQPSSKNEPDNKPSFIENTNNGGTESSSTNQKTTFNSQIRQNRVQLKQNIISLSNSKKVYVHVSAKQTPKNNIKRLSPDFRCEKRQKSPDPQSNQQQQDLSKMKRIKPDIYIISVGGVPVNQWVKYQRSSIRSSKLSTGPKKKVQFADQLTPDLINPTITNTEQTTPKNVSTSNPKIFDKSKTGSFIELVEPNHAKFACNGPVILLKKPLEDAKPVTFRVERKYRSNFSIGACERSIVKDHNFDIHTIVHQQHGCYLLSSNGFLWASGYKDRYLDKKNRMRIKAGDTIQVILAASMRMLVINNFNIKASITVEIHESIDIKNLYACVQMEVEEEAIRLIDSLNNGFDIEGRESEGLFFNEGVLSRNKTVGQLTLVNGNLIPDHIYRFKITRKFDNSMAFGICLTENWSSYQTDKITSIYHKDCLLFYCDGSVWFCGLGKFKVSSKTSGFHQGDTVTLEYRSDREQLVFGNSRYSKTCVVSLKNCVIAPRKISVRVRLAAKDESVVLLN